MISRTGGVFKGICVAPLAAVITDAILELNHDSVIATFVISMTAHSPRPTGSLQSVSSQLVPGIYGVRIITTFQQNPCQVNVTAFEDYV
jgi:hypothetical protein